ncbi:DUF350 domain-containing protein [Actinomyces weissii]|uniref:DUF350 domain-containing protein n=2 Tax=Actinomyces weissii TaxID=675090 RepID=A0A7T7MB95_9ACTO|nr:DUF350 domain-containing protein [Actinomyces weissii]
MLNMVMSASAGGGLDATTILATVVYAVLGMVLLLVFAVLASVLLRLDLRRELVEENNPGLGTAFAGVAVAIAIIIAATIVG